MFEFGAYANYLDNLDCSHSLLAVFYNKFFISGSKILSLSLKAVVRTCACAISHDHLDFWLYMFGSRCQNQDKFTVSLILRRKFIFIFSRKLFKFIAYANSLDHLNCIYSELAVLYNTINISGTKFRSHQRTQLLELARVLFLLTTWISDCLFLAHIVKIRMNSLKG